MVDYHLAYLDFIAHFHPNGESLMDKWISTIPTCADDIERVVSKMRRTRHVETIGIRTRLYFYARYMHHKCGWSEEQFEVEYLRLR